MNIRKEIYKHPLLVKYIRFIYHDIIEGFINGYYWYMIKYTLNERKKEILALHSLGFEDIKLYKTRSWRRGHELDHAHRRYYTARYDKKQAFIKIAKNDKTIQNEIDVAEIISEKGFMFTPKKLLSCSSFRKTYKLLAIEFEEYLHPIPVDINEDEMKRCCREFLFIHKSLSDIKLVHADIHKGNLMFNSDNHLVLFDFGISRFLDKNNKVDYVARPGTFYQRTKNGRIYDDAYSFLSMLEKMPAYPEVINSVEYREIKDRIGLTQFEVNINENSIVNNLA